MLGCWTLCWDQGGQGCVMFSPPDGVYVFGEGLWKRGGQHSEGPTLADQSQQSFPGVAGNMGTKGQALVLGLKP